MPEQSAHVHLLLPADMRDQLRETAAANYRSVSGEVRALLAEHLKSQQADQPVPPPDRWEGTQ
jgi:plasmid stability protein